MIKIRNSTNSKVVRMFRTCWGPGPRVGTGSTSYFEWGVANGVVQMGCYRSARRSDLAARLSHPVCHSTKTRSISSFLARGPSAHPGGAPAPRNLLFFVPGELPYTNISTSTTSGWSAGLLPGTPEGGYGYGSGPPRAGTVSISPGLQTVGGEARAGLLNAVGGCNGTNATTMAPAPEAETQMYPPVVDEKPAGAGHEGRKSQHADRNNPDAKPWDSAE